MSGTIVWKRTGLSVAMLAALAGCATNPVTGRRNLMLVSSDTERRLGAEEAAKVEATIGLVRDSTLVAWVQSVGTRLAAEAPGGFRYEFNVVDMVEPNAFALPAGWVYVSRGLLALVNSEDELAGVIGHEIGHVAARHAVQRISLAAPLGVATGIAAAATRAVAPRIGGLVAGVGDLTTAVVTNPYSRAQELEADEFGQRAAAGAGWDPAALATFLRTLEREEALAGEVRTPGFLSSHPATPTRAADAEARARDLAPAAYPRIAGDRAAVLRRLDGLVVGPSPATGVVRGARFLHPDLDFSVAFPERWAIANETRLVVAAEPSKRAGIALQAVAESGDPAAAATAFAERNGIAFTSAPRRTRIGGLDAVRAATIVRDGGRIAHLDLTWIRHGAALYLLSGACAAGDAATFAPLFERTATSFRPLGAAERGSFEILRLRVVAARAGETPQDVVARTKSAWSPATLAVANALDPDVRLPAGHLLKVAVREPYPVKGGR